MHQHAGTWAVETNRRSLKGLGSQSRLAGHLLYHGLSMAGSRRFISDPDRFVEPEALTLAPLPCWKHLSPEVYRAHIASLIRQIEKDAAVQREAHGRQFLGADTILRQDPRTEPNRTKKSPAPRFHAVRKWVRKELYQTYPHLAL
jgi:hypothetical protein